MPPPLSLHEPQTWPQLLSATQVAGLLLVDRQTVVAMIDRGELAGSKIGPRGRLAADFRRCARPLAARTVAWPRLN